MFEGFKIQWKMLDVNSYKTFNKGGLYNYKWEKLNSK